MAEGLCAVEYVPSIGDMRYSGGYYGRPDPADRLIQIRRSVGPGRHNYPIRTDLHVLVNEAGVLAHEIAHARHQIEDPDRFSVYMGALSRWYLRDISPPSVPRPPFDDNDRGRIYEEESLAETDGRELILAIIPELLVTFDRRAVDSLNSYVNILWEGKWPDGTEFKWKNMEEAKRRDDSLLGEALNR